MRIRLILFYLLTCTAPLAGADDLTEALYIKPLNTFGTQLLREATAHDTQGAINRMVSPVANYMALGMTLEGAAAATRDQLIKALHLSPDDQLAHRNRECTQHLVSTPPEDQKTIARMRISNGAWATNQVFDGQPFIFSQVYQNSLRSFYNAEIGTMDFQSVAAETEINAWAKRETLGLIPRVVKSEEIRELIFLLMNATYFEGSWSQPFHQLPVEGWNKEATTFHTADGRAERRTMISNTGYYAHVKRGGEEFIEIPFDSPANQDFVFYVALPKEGAPLPSEADQAMDWTKVRDALNEAPAAYGSITMPKFSFDYTYELKDESPLTRAMNLEFLFSDHANFSAMATPESLRAKVGLIKGVNRIELDEKGVKAAAVVMVGGMMATSVGPSPSFNMHVNRPFAFAIAEKTTGALIFVGEVQDPE